MSGFLIYQDSAGLWRFQLRAENVQILAVSEAYTRRPGARRGTEAVRRAAAGAEIVEIERTAMNHEELVSELREAAEDLDRLADNADAVGERYEAQLLLEAASTVRKARRALGAAQ